MLVRLCRQFRLAHINEQEFRCWREGLRVFGNRRSRILGLSENQLKSLQICAQISEIGKEK